MSGKWSEPSPKQVSRPGRTMAGRERPAGGRMPSGHTKRSAPRDNPLLFSLGEWIQRITKYRAGSKSPIIPFRCVFSVRTALYLISETWKISRQKAHVKLAELVILFISSVPWVRILSVAAQRGPPARVPCSLSRPLFLFEQC